MTKATSVTFSEGTLRRLKAHAKGDNRSVSRELEVLATEAMDIRERWKKKAGKAAAVPAIEDIISGLAAQVPDEQWKELPADLTDNLDHYVYGTPKK
jgi:hypothetical protein